MFLYQTWRAALMLLIIMCLSNVGRMNFTHPYVFNVLNISILSAAQKECYLRFVQKALHLHSVL